MKNITYIFIMMMLISVPVFGDFEDTGFGARTSGMGNSFVGLADDIYAMVYNPGGVGRIKGSQFGVSYRKLYLGLDDNSDIGEGFAGYVHHIGASNWLKRAFPGISDLGTIGAGIINLNDGSLYSETTFILSYGKALRNSDNGGIFAGTNLKMLNKKYSANEYTENSIDFLGNTYGKDPVFEGGYGKSVFGIDLGVYLQFNQKFSAGVTARNLNQPDTGLKDSSVLPAQYKLGLCYRVDSLNILLDGEYKGKDITFSPGFEKWLYEEKLALRCGFQSGSRGIGNMSVGCSYEYEHIIRLDYSFIMPFSGIKDTSGSHGMGLAIFFDEWARYAMINKEPEGYQEAVKCYEKKELISAYYRFMQLMDTDMMEKYYHKSSAYLEKIKKSMIKAANEGATEKESKYASGFLYYIDNKYKECIEEWNEVLKKEPENREVSTYLNMVKAKFDEKKKSRQDKYFAEAMRLYSAKKNTQAITVLEKLLKIDPGNIEALKLVKEIRDKTEDNKEISATRYFIRGLRYYSETNYEKAIEQWKNCLNLDKEFEEAKEYIDIAKNKVKKIKSSIKTASSIAKEKSIAPKMGGLNSIEAERYYNDGLIKYEQGQLEEAILDLQKALQNDTTHWSANEALKRIKFEYKQQHETTK